MLLVTFGIGSLVDRRYIGHWHPVVQALIRGVGLLAIYLVPHWFNQDPVTRPEIIVVFLVGVIVTLLWY